MENPRAEGSHSFHHGHDRDRASRCRPATPRSEHGRHQDLLEASGLYARLYGQRQAVNS